MTRVATLGIVSVLESTQQHKVLAGTHTTMISSPPHAVKSQSLLTSTLIPQRWLKDRGVWWDEELVQLRSPLRPPKQGDKIPPYLLNE